MTDVKKTILARRARFVAAAIAGAGMAVGCSSTESSVCLSMPGPSDAAMDGDKDGSGDVSMEAQACLSIAAEAGPDADGGPQMCLQPYPEDAQDELDAGPQMCLQPPPDDAGG